MGSPAEVRIVLAWSGKEPDFCADRSAKYIPIVRVARQQKPDPWAGSRRVKPVSHRPNRSARAILRG